jgi:NADPH:quinone reductase-like Zn-dependent oxidoreductase
VGPGIRPDWIGRPVVALTRFGGYADTAVVPEVQVVEKPASLGNELGAALLVNYLTAWQLLVVMGGLRAGDTLLIHNAGGGVGLAAIDIARHVGATIFGTASPRKHQFLKERGVHETIDYVGRDWTVEVMRLTGGRGVELIVDPLGGKHWKKSYAALRHTGRLGVFGASTVTESRLPGALAFLAVGFGMPWFNPVSLMNQNRGAFGVNLGHLWDETDKIRAWIGIVIDGVAEGWVRPHVDRSFPLERAGEAQAYLEARRNIGKVVLTA